MDEVCFTRILCLKFRFARHFQTILNFNMTVNEEYYDVDDWWRRPAMVILLSRENAISHRAGLLAGMLLARCVCIINSVKKEN